MAKPKISVRKPPASPDAFVAAGVNQPQLTSVGGPPRKATPTGRARLTVWLPADLAERFTAQCLADGRTLASGVERLVRASLEGRKLK
jgi:hypothetical protein